MLKRALLASGAWMAVAAAWVVAQERPATSILSKPIQTIAPRAANEPRPLATALRQAQQTVVEDHQEPARLPAGPAVAPAAFTGPTPPAAPRASFSIQSRGDGGNGGDSVQVPAILSGRPSSSPPANGPAANPSASRPSTAGAPAQTPAPRVSRSLSGDAPLAPPASLTTQTPQTTDSGFGSSGAFSGAGPRELPTPNSRAAETNGLGAALPQAPGGRSRVIETDDSSRVSPITMGIRGPSLRVDAVGPGSISVGKLANYEITISNVGALPAEGVLVAIDFPAHVAIEQSNASNGEVETSDGSQMARIIWTVQQVATGGEQRLNLGLRPTQNQAFDFDLEWTFMPLTNKARVEVTQPSLDLNIAGPSEVLFGEQAKFVFEVTNSGTGDAENVLIRLPAELGGQEKSLGTIAAGQSRSFEIQVAAVQAGEVELSGTAVADGGLEKSASKTFVVRRGELKVGLVGPEFKYAGTVATYDLTIQNVGDAVAKNVIAAAALPAGSDYVDGVEGGEQVEGGVRWDIGDLNAGEQRVYSIRCILNSAGQLQFEAGARGDGELADAKAVGTLVEAVADLTLVVEDPKGPKPVGETVTYTLKIVNRGSKAATQVNLLTQFSDGIEPKQVKGLPGEVIPGQVVFEPIAQIDAGQEIVVQVMAEASSEGNHVFRAELTCDSPETRRLFEGTTKFFGRSQVPSTANRTSSGGGFSPSRIQR